MQFMRQIETKIMIFACAVSLLGGGLTACGADSNGLRKGEAGGMGKRHIMLLGASVGKAWSLAEFSQRMNENQYVLESMAIYQFDKTDALEEVLMRPKKKFRLTRTYIKGLFEPAPQIPDVILIKECAAYFPGELSTYKEWIGKWVKRIKESRKEVILATVVPVTRERAATRKGQSEAISEFNDWLRDYARLEKITLLDLEAELRISPRERFLQDTFTSGDGMHLNKTAYDVLDKVLLAALKKTD
jgi:hypothetical protein